MSEELNVFESLPFKMRWGNPIVPKESSLENILLLQPDVIGTTEGLIFTVGVK